MIAGKLKDLGGGFVVARYVPTTACRSVGPFIFLDQMGPVKVSLKSKLDVRPHPHIGLATVTYLLAGEGLHRDSLGSVQVIRPGDINYMTAGNGIVHSERTPDEFLSNINLERSLHGLQFWVALPKEDEECAPSFVHYSKNQLPVKMLNPNVECKVLIGAAHQIQSSVKTKFKTLFLDYTVLNDIDLALNFEADQIGILCISEKKDSSNEEFIKINDIWLKNQSFHFSNEPNVSISAKAGARFIVFGGEKLPEPRYMWWNFVSTKRELIRTAAERWKVGQFPKVPGEIDFIPLPNDPLP